jgi:hypothetical protein
MLDNILRERPLDRCAKKDLRIEQKRSVVVAAGNKSVSIRRPRQTTDVLTVSVEFGQ